MWSPDDTKLVSGGMDGAVYEWRIKDLKREKENVLKVRRCVDCLCWQVLKGQGGCLPYGSEALSGRQERLDKQ